jgi:hypothetical protein
MEPMQSDWAFAIDGIPSGVGRVLVLPDVLGFRRLAATGDTTSSDSYTFNREYGDYAGTGQTDTADLMLMAQNFNISSPVRRLGMVELDFFVNGMGDRKEHRSCHTILQ